MKNHPLLDGNNRVALLATIEFCGRNCHVWSPAPGDEDGEATGGETERKAVRTVRSFEDIDPADRIWLEQRLVEYRDILLYLHDH